MSAALLDEYDGGAAARRATAISDGDGGGGGGGGGCCEGYAPHLSAILLLLLIVTAKAPTLYALLLLHQNEPQPLFLSCVLVDVVYLFTWLAYWFVLTIKRDWSFRLPTAPYVYKPNLTGGVNPPAPANLFDTYRRSENDAKSATLYVRRLFLGARRCVQAAICSNPARTRRFGGQCDLRASCLPPALRTAIMQRPTAAAASRRRSKRRRSNRGERAI